MASSVKEWLSEMEKSVISLKNGSKNHVSCEQRTGARNLEFADSLLVSSNFEHGSGIQRALQSVSAAFNNITKERTKMINALKNTVISKLGDFPGELKNSKEALSKRNTVSDKVKMRSKTIAKLDAKSKRDDFKIAQIRQQLNIDQVELSICERDLNEKTAKAEEVRITTMKDVLERLIRCQIYLHSRAIESFSEAFISVANVDADADLIDITSKLGGLMKRSRSVTEDSKFSVNDDLELK